MWSDSATQDFSCNLVVPQTPRRLGFRANLSKPILLSATHNVVLMLRTGTLTTDIKANVPAMQKTNTSRTMTLTGLVELANWVTVFATTTVLQPSRNAQGGNKCCHVQTMTRATAENS